MLTNFHIHDDVQWNFSEIPVPTEIPVEFQWNFSEILLVDDWSLKFH